MTKSPDTPVERRTAADPETKPLGAGELRSRTRQQTINEAQAIVAPQVPRGRDLVSELIAERREEATRE